ncbi:hypothetical protein [uncultured Alsobacter sp.]|uniref:hypothetical protein n=1 Tax=uncultured Alsobacter sp. TaxID=1748258 RepID=UPI0025EBBE4A|nr:hypothetical protein [uncultured Alsobacter sp.]
MRPAEPAPKAAVTSPRDAEAMVEALIGLMGSLNRVVLDETELLRASRLREAATLADAKSDAAKAYVQGLDALKSNAIALARWAPASVARLKQAQASLAEALSVNMAVLATARSVSEGIVRSLAAEVDAPRTLNTYGQGRQRPASRQSPGPLMISKSL